MANPIQEPSPVSRPARIAAGAVRLYQLVLSPLMLPNCRHLPTCSEYAIEALREHGVLRGGWLAAWRIAPLPSVRHERVRPGAGARESSAPAGLVMEDRPVDGPVSGSTFRRAGMRCVRPVWVGMDCVGRER